MILYPLPRRLLALLNAFIWASLALGQDDLFDKAPPHIDSALRARVEAFYQAHVDGKFRHADTMVHEDSKDAFFVADKQQYKNFDLIKINYEAEFTRATAVVVVGTDFFMPPVGKIPVMVPMSTFWKLDGGEWWWYVKPPDEEGKLTPFGRMKPGPDPDPSSPYHRFQNRPSASDITSKIEVSKTELAMDCSRPASREVTVTNRMHGAVLLNYTVPETSGFTGKLDTESLKDGEVATLTLSCEARESLSGKQVRGILHIQPTNQQIPIVVTFAKTIPAPAGRK